MTEFNLSEERQLDKEVPRCYYWEESVKEFIRLLKEKMQLHRKVRWIDTYIFRDIIDKLAGDALK